MLKVKRMMICVLLWGITNEFPLVALSSIAQKLFAEAASTAHEEANLRCSISRAYYAAFHDAKQN